MSMSVRIQLSVMMFLQFFVWGSWYATMGAYLKAIGFDGDEVGTIGMTVGLGAIISPIFVGMVADRFFAAQKVMGILHLAGAAFMYWATTILTPGLFFWALLGHTLCYMSTLALVNAIAMNQMEDPEREFGPIRVLGTLGWIAAGFAITALAYFQADLKIPENTVQPFRMAAIVSAILGLYSFTLPNTPPRSAGQKVTLAGILNLDALKLMKDRSFAVLVTCSLLVCIPLTFYYTFTSDFLVDVGVEKVAFKMTFGQMSEIFFLLVMPFFFIRLGVKNMILVGIIAWIARYVLFAFGDNETMVWMLYTGIILHGICFDFFFVTGQIYVDKAAPERLRASAQGLIMLATYGVGMTIGSKVSGVVVGHFQSLDEAGEVVTAWTNVWLVPAALAFIVLLIFAALFQNPKQGEKIAVEEAEA